MARSAPSAVLIVRHGARLDVADKDWYLTSPAPYDPPLTYGGWAQAQALGVRIASLLADLQAGDASAATDCSSAEVEATPRRKRRRQSIVLHSSPFLRCVQTAIGIAAGIAQFQPAPLSARLCPSGLDGTGPAQEESSAPRSPPKTRLRTDGFLGEWLHSEYFEDISPPPSSPVMVMAAKGELLRSGPYVEVAQGGRSISGHFPGGWFESRESLSRGMRSHADRRGTDGAFVAMGSLAQALPRERCSSQGTPARAGLGTAPRPPVPLSGNRYKPPVPSYAVSPSNPIPHGYVEHARDACVDIDYHWDSIRAPQAWGDGGDFPEEWSAMHRRMRSGLGGIVSWYSAHDADHGNGPPAAEGSPTADADGEDVVVVLVTHGACCNALLGAMMNKPILIDVGLASLSMAVRRDGAEPRSSSGSHPVAVDTASLAKAYEIKMLASADHLRPGTDPAQLPVPVPPPAAPVTSLENRRRFDGICGSLGASSSLGEPLRGPDGSLTSLGPNPSQSPPALAGMQGLWSRTPSQRSDSVETSSESDFLLNFDDPRPPAGFPGASSNQPRRDQRGRKEERQVWHGL